MAATVTPADPLVIMFTSGSSGAPKGVVHSHGNALGAVRSGLAARCITSDTRLYLPMPFFWVGGFGSGILSALIAGATLVTEERPQPDTTLRLLEKERVTLFRGWPDQAEALARHPDRARTDLSALRPGSLEALLPVEQRAQTGARATLFGMTEAFGPYCGYAADTDMPASAWGSCGKPFPGMEVRIVDPDTGEAVPAETIGMIQLRGPHTLRGICRRSREELFTVDGFYPTGDLGRLDENGYLFYHGRSDDMFKVSGATVYPSEVERALRTIEGVDNAFVTNVSGTAGQRVGAAVVCHDAHRRSIAQSGTRTAERVQGADGLGAAGIRRRRSARRYRKGRYPAATGDVDRGEPALRDPRPGLTVLRLEGLDRRVDIREHRSDRDVRLDYVLLVRIGRAVGEPCAHRVLGRHIVYPNPEGRRRTARAVEARCNVGPDNEDTVPGNRVHGVGNGGRRQHDRRHAGYESGCSAKRTREAHLLSPVLTAPEAVMAAYAQSARPTTDRQLFLNA